ncbi:MAG: alpha/beta fold hydrolase [Burkholderiales bacterium]|nr:alpha/beta hydrolase [Burkholderiales bacterium]MDQ3196667.1 alpha/beta hydrolase [Pseudomonadota bacterium]
MKNSHSHYPDIRSLSYHVRTWGDPSHARLFLLHGWMDTSISFQFLVDEFARDWYVVAPDWRGFGYTEWSDYGYWFADYIADLDALLTLFQPEGEVRLVGHSMGGNVACLYAGIRPQRVGAVVSLEGFGIPRMAAESAPERYSEWLTELTSPPRFKPYTSFEQIAERLQRNNPRLPDDKALFLARFWAKQLPSGEIVANSDPRHKTINPVLYRIDEAMSCWKRVTAPVLWVAGNDSWIHNWLKESREEFARRQQAFRNFTEVAIDDAGHMLHHDQPGHLARIIENFVL